MVLLPFYRGATFTVADLSVVRGSVLAMGDEPLVGRAVSDHFVVTLNRGRQLIIEL
jgi:hypothetical protein